MVIHGLSLSFGDNHHGRDPDLHAYVRQTSEMMIDPAAIGESRKVIELESQGTDALSPSMILDTDLRPFMHSNEMICGNTSNEG